MQIKNRLNELFKTHRLIFWYDGDKEYEEVVKDLDIDRVKILYLDNNEFGIKVEVLTNKEQRYLIYSPYPMPPDKDNWLLDLVLSHYEFKADKISEILENLGIDLSFREFVKKYKKFFNSKKRLEEFKRKIESQNEDEFLLKMIAILLKSEDSFEYVLLNAFEKGIEELEKFNLKEDFFKLIEKRFGIIADNLNSLKLQLFNNYFEYNLKGRSFSKDARIFLKFWMENVKFRELFKEVSREVGKELNIFEKLKNYKIEDIIRCELFEECEKYIINYLVNNFLDENIEEIIHSRKNKIWFEGFENIYNALLYANKLLKFKIKEVFGFDGWIESYANELYKADFYYRKYYYFKDKAEHIEILKNIDEKIEDFYLNEFLRVVNDEFNKYIKEYKITQNHQQNFFENHIKPESNKKLFVIISDGLRYECGVELNEKINSINRFKSKTNYMISSLPSYTYLGMAALLPHKSLTLKDDRIFVDDKDCTSIDKRDRILKSYNQKYAALSYEEFLKMNRTEGREFCKNHEVIYIYHNEIDNTGEKDEINTFQAVNKTIETLLKLIKQIQNFNGYNILITSDHGFLFTKSPTKPSELCEKPKGEFIKLNRRFAIGKGKEDKCVVKFCGDELNIKSVYDFFIAKSINKFRIQGGGHRYVHGGATLEEIVIPFLKVKYHRKEDVRDVEVEIIPISHVSTNIVNLTLYQKEPVSEKIKSVTLKVYFKLNDEILSDIEQITFDIKDEYEENREKKIKLTFKNEIKNYNNKEISLVIEKVKDGTSFVYKEMKVKVNIAFFNEFYEW